MMPDMAIWHLEPEYATVHGVFSPDFSPVLTIDPGDTVVFRTLEAGWGTQARDPSLPPMGPRPLFEPSDPARRGDGHCLVGPVAIRGAEPGTTLEIRVEDIVVGSFGWTGTGSNPITIGAGVPEGQTGSLFWELDADHGIGRNQFGHEVSLRPFMGVMGMPPAEAGLHSTIPPRATGGNIDCNELVAGTTLYLPVAVSGGLFSVGDGHGAQGDGEVSVTAIECPMERVRLRFDVVSDMPLAVPRARTPDSWITFGFHEDLDLAAAQATGEMMRLLAAWYGLTPAEALALASVTVDLRVTQVVNRVKGVHAVLKDGAIRLPNSNPGRAADS